MNVDKEEELDQLVLDLWEAMMQADISDAKCQIIEMYFLDLVKRRWQLS